MAKRQGKSSARKTNDAEYSTEIGLFKVGKLAEAKIIPGKLTILSGPNGSGKTSALYSIYGILAQRIARFRTAYTDELAKSLLEAGSITVDLKNLSGGNWESLLGTATQFFTDNLPDVLNCDASLLPGAQVKFRVDRDRSLASWSNEWNFSNAVMAGDSVILSAEMDEERPALTFRVGEKNAPLQSVSHYIANVLFDVTAFPLMGKAYLLPSERAGINLFYQELNSRRTALINNLQKREIDPAQLMRDVMRSRYAKPVADYIDLLNEFVGVKMQEAEFSFLADQLDKIALGSFELSKDGSIFFRPVGSKKSKLSLHLAASSAKSLYGLSQLLRYRLESHDVVMIDEPELNLHPDAQRSFAQFIALMVSQGLNVMISTHSDYIVREINTLMLAKNDALKINPADVELYVFSSKGVATRVDKVDGGNFSVDPFEASIRALNDAFATAALG